MGSVSTRKPPTRSGKPTANRRRATYQKSKAGPVGPAFVFQIRLSIGSGRQHACHRDTDPEHGDNYNDPIEIPPPRLGGAVCILVGRCTWHVNGSIGDAKTMSEHPPFREPYLPKTQVKRER
ncbi:hypothetical protein JANAI62_29410 [Jannaschia pagri]|uniref:Uncharacterized protein n=1 Tax=Jannaschia pagri TaxID=2829797 RepID=A0ABQ4NPL4_9RHOB|nr:hypothetical protein JANAI61_29410 [Jannaschia sp. AI_61]GIT96318.1 hypothetical protein JANAI62_29410 [Jannaschia sp. AI_62]